MYSELLNSSWYRKKIGALKDKYRGARCFIAGNGPSLAYTPLEHLRDEFSFGLNKIADIYPKTTWRPDFYTAVSATVSRFPPHVPATLTAINEPDTISFINVEDLSLLFGAEDEDARTKTHVVPHSVMPVRVSFKHYRPKLDPGCWSFDIAKRVSKDGSSMMAVMQIAAYMGFNPLILIGCDLGLKAWDYTTGEKDPNHFSEDYWGELRLGGKPYILTPSYTRGVINHITMGHRIAKRVCDSQNIKIYNATLGGELEVYPRVDFATIVKG